MGCSIVWFIDLIQIGGSEKTLAVAASAGPERRTSICSVQIPAMATHEHHQLITGIEEEEKNHETMPFNINNKCCYQTCCSSYIVPDNIIASSMNETNHKKGRGRRPSPSHKLVSKILHCGTSKMCKRRESINKFSVDELLAEDTKENDGFLPHSFVDDAVSRHIVFSGKK